MEEQSVDAGEWTPREFASFSPSSAPVGFGGPTGVRSETILQLIAQKALTRAAKCRGGVGKAVPDIWTPAKRSEVMSRIRSRDTLPERAMRAALRRQHVKYRSYRKVRGITVDLLLPDLHTIVLVHGCFWHGCREHYMPPSSNTDFWSFKLRQNKERDNRQAVVLRASGWHLARVWEHSLSSAQRTDRTVRRLLRVRRKSQTAPRWSPRDQCSLASGPDGRYPASTASRSILAPW